MKLLFETIMNVLDGHTAINPIPRERILGALQAQGENISDRGMRALVADLVTNHEIPIGSNGRGYFMVLTDGDLLEADRALKDKALSIFERRNALIKAYQATQQKKVQLQLI
jgi:hypothetical protein